MTDSIIDKLSEAERITIARALIFLIRIDGRIDQHERERMHEIVEIYNLSNSLDALKGEITEAGILTEIKKNIVGRSKALFTLRELLTVANIDDDFDIREAAIIDKIAAVLNIEDEKVLDINELVLDKKLWLFKEAQVMEIE